MDVYRKDNYDNLTLKYDFTAEGQAVANMYELSLIHISTAAPVQQAEASQQVSMSYGAVPFDLAAGTDQWWSIDSSDSAYWAVAENINAMRAAAGLPADVYKRQVYEIWEKTKEQRSTQMIFCDLSTPKEDGFDVYNDVRDKLVAKGIPKEEVQFIHDADTETKKAELFGKVRNGTVRVLMGSTQKMGAGTNVQTRLIALHHLDCPWPVSYTHLDVYKRQGPT